MMRPHTCQSGLVAFFLAVPSLLPSFPISHMTSTRHPGPSFQLLMSFSPVIRPRPDVDANTAYKVAPELQGMLCYLGLMVFVFHSTVHASLLTQHDYATFTAHLHQTLAPYITSNEHTSCSFSNDPSISKLNTQCMRQNLSRLNRAVNNATTLHTQCPA
jgi:hypothetical protein